ATAAVKPGTKCTKLGQTSTSAGIKYTCIKSGKNLVWDKGVSVKAAAKPELNPVFKPAEPIPIATPTITPNPDTTNQSKGLLSQDPRITPILELTNIQTCKTTDKTPDYIKNGISVSKNGFPRPVQALSGAKSGKLLVIPMGFKDLPFQVSKVQRGGFLQSDYETLMETIPKVQQAYKTLSNGRFEVTIDVLPQKDWWIFDSKQPFSAVWGVPNIPVIGELIKTSKSDFKFDDYDGYVFIAGNDPATGWAIGAGQSAFAESVTNSKKGYFNGILMVGGFSDVALWIHELGHGIFALEDLYLFDQTTNNIKIPSFDIPLLWEVMANVRVLELLEWQRLLNGWLYDSEVRCLSNQTLSTHYLAQNGASTDPKLLTINLAPGVTLAAEVRKDYSSLNGLLLYLVNTFTPHGQGPIISSNVLLSKGQSKSLLGWKITVIDTDSTGVLFTAEKTDIDKFVSPPERTPPPNTSNPVLPPVVDRNSNLDGQGCQRGEADVTNTFGRFICTTLPDGNNLWKKSG
ncbi:MAG: hypothetical protein WCJ43_06735, partial [Actinomycetes bacterium]